MKVISKKKQIFLIGFIILLISLLMLYIHFKKINNSLHLSQNKKHPFKLARGEPKVLENGTTFDVRGVITDIKGDYLIIKEKEEEKIVKVDETTHIFRLNLEEMRKQDLEDAPRERINISKIKIGDGADIICNNNAIHQVQTVDSSIEMKPACIASYIEIEPQ